MNEATVERLKTALSGRYEIRGELGEGGMATVYLADDLRHDRRVALKVLKPELAAALGAERFLAEIKLTAGLQHPHILPLHDSGESDGSLYYVMPYAQGESLRDRLKREKQLPIDEALAIARAVASALDYAHRHDVVHRDIKPENILLHEGEAMVADFGIALAVSSVGPDRMTEAGLSVGTPAYMSPEQATGEREVDGRTDIYALACVLYEMLAGQPPYTDSTLQAMIARLLTEQPVHPRLLRETVSEELDAAVMKGLAKVPADRFRSAAEFGQALTAAETAAVPAPRSRRPTVLEAAFGVVTVGALALAAVVLLRPDAPGAAVVREERQLTFDGSVQEAAMSPLGDFFTYLTFQDGVRQLYVQEVGNDNAIRLDSIQDFMCCAAWSPDGSQIAYRRGTRSAGTTVVIPRLGGSRREIRADVALAWSADASRLLSWWPAARYLTISDMATASLVDSIPLGDGHTWVNGADWSPDGERVTVALQDSLGFGIRTLELDGTVIDELVTDTAALTSPRWARDGRGIYYVRAGDGVWKVDVSADGVVRGEPSLIVSDLSSFVSNAIVPAINISDDGDRLLYNRYVGHSNLWRFGSFDTNGGEPAERQPLTRGTADRRTPRLSPDGSTLAYVDVVEGRANLYLIPSAGGTPRQVTFFEQTVWSPAWSPDGSTIAVGAVEGGESGLWLVDVQGGTLRKVDLASFEGDEIAWAPGREIVFQNRGHVELRAVDPGTWQERVVVAQGQMTWWYDLRPAPDGRTLFARRTGGASGMWRVDVATGAAQQVADVVKAPVGWSADASTVYTMDIDSRTHLEREIYRLPAGGGRPELHLRLPLGQAVNALQVAVSPDGRTVFASVQVSSTDVWIVEPFDPR